MFRRMIASIMILAVTMCLTPEVQAARNIGDGNGRDSTQFFVPSEMNSDSRPKTKTKNVKGDQWIIYWYACGTDIESGRILFGPGTDLMTNEIVLAEPTRRTGDVTRCIRELERADLSSGKVTVLMQAGGTMVWGHEKFRSNNARIEVLGKMQDRDNPQNWNLKTSNQTINLQYNRLIKPGTLARYVYSDKERDWNPKETFAFDFQNPATDMGNGKCLEDFLSYGKKMEQELYPDGNVRRMFIFRNHGGGSLLGVCKDMYTGKSISLKDLQAAFAKVWETSPQTTLNEPPFEVVGFDMCQMSTYETAVALEGIAHYMIASQASTYGRVSYDYDAFVSQLSQNPKMSGQELSKMICNTYREDALRTEDEYAGVAGIVTDKLTVSVTDITKVPALTVAYENFGEALRKSAGDFQNDFITEATGIFLRSNNPNEQYGLWMVDLKELATEFGKTFPGVKGTSNKLLKSLNETVIYNLRGDGKGIYATRFPNGGGLSTYYPVFHNDRTRETKIDFRKVKDYANLENLAPKSMRELYVDMSRRFDPGSQAPQGGGATNPPGDKVDSPTVATPPKSRSDLSDLLKVKPQVDPVTKTARIELDKDLLSRIAGVRCQVAWFNYYKNENSASQLDAIFLGSDTGIRENWKTGEFKSTFSGKWLKLEGRPVFVQVVTEATKKDSRGNIIGGYEIYAIPIYLNDRPCTLSVSCEYPGQKFRIIGAQPDSDSELPVDEIYGLNKGDVVKPVYIRFKVSFETDEEVLSVVTGEPFTIGDKVLIEPGTLPDGRYAYMFEFVNPVGGLNVYTNPIEFEIKEGKVSSTKSTEEIQPEKTTG